MTQNAPSKDRVSPFNGELTRREFIRYSAWTCASLSLGSLAAGCGGGDGDTVVQHYPIDPDVKTTLDRMLAFDAQATPGGLPIPQMRQVAQYGPLGYGNWTWGSGLPAEKRTELMPVGYIPPSLATSTRLLHFFTISDIHITDKEAPNQLIQMQQTDAHAGTNTSIYSPVMMCTTHVLDAAIQTVNALHRKKPFDLGISLGDTCNCTSYNELRWYIDVIDGKVITPSSGAHAGADSIDYQRPYQAAGLDKSIRWYQALGNHDHFFIGSFPIDADPTLGLRQAYIADTVWNVGDVLVPNGPFPALFNMENLKVGSTYYMGTFDGRTQTGTIIGAGQATNAEFAAGAPKVVADPDRRSLVRAEWVKEFFDTSTLPVGHGFNLVDPVDAARHGNGFACYSFVPNPKFPLKIIVLDDTQSEKDGSVDIHGHGYLDADRWAWLQAELDKGQAYNQLMIVACHVPIGVSAIGSETEWWGQTDGIAPQYQNAVDLTGLVHKLWNTPNLLMWIAGHRHLNVVKAFPPLGSAPPEQGFWQVETSSLRDFPQQFRTFEVLLNSDYTITIVTTNVDPSVAEGTPAATSRKYAVAVQQIVQNPVMQASAPNLKTKTIQTAAGPVTVHLPTMDPSRHQSDDVTLVDKTIHLPDMSQYPKPVQVNGSYNCELFKQLSPQMVAALKAQFPQPA